MKNQPDRKPSPLWASVAIAALAFVSAAALAQGGATPGVPTGLRVTTTPTQIELAWDGALDASSVTQYRVYRTEYNTCVGSAGWSCAAWYSAETLLDTISGLPLRTSTKDVAASYTGRFDYSVAACNAADVCSARSLTVSVRTPVSTQPAQELQVSATGSGYGAVVSDPAGISCYMPRPDVRYLIAPDCVESYSSAQTVTLTARADSDSVFVGWRGACSGKSPTCTVAIKPSSLTAAQAYFMRPRVTADCVFDWAEAHFPVHLAPRAATTLSAAGYRFRYYAGTDSYLGLSEDDLHIYFLKSGQTLVDLGDVSALAETTLCK